MNWPTAECARNSLRKQQAIWEEQNMLALLGARVSDGQPGKGKKLQTQQPDREPGCARSGRTEDERGVSEETLMQLQ